MYQWSSDLKLNGAHIIMLQTRMVLMDIAVALYSTQTNNDWPA